MASLWFLYGYFSFILIVLGVIARSPPNHLNAQVTCAFPPSVPVTLRNKRRISSGAPHQARSGYFIPLL